MSSHEKKDDCSKNGIPVPVVESAEDDSGRYTVPQEESVLASVGSEKENALNNSGRPVFESKEDDHGRGDAVPQEEGVLPSAGSILMSQFPGNSSSDADLQGIPVHETVSCPVLRQHSESESVKAFFGSDTPDSGPQSAPSYEYNMKHKFRGCFIIFNHKKFKKRLDLPDRTGTDEDKINLEITAKNLGFEYVKSFDDLKLEQIKSVVKKLSKADHSEYDCFGMAILTHGKPNDILYAYDDEYHIDMMVEPFTARHCKSLAGKPKLLFIQACRGDKLDPGHTMPSNGDTVDGSFAKAYNDSKENNVVIPNSADFLLAFSTTPGYYAWRNMSFGSWFIQALCKCLDEFGDQLELMQIMTRVNRMVAYDFESECYQLPKFHQKKQIPSIVTRLTHEIFFHPKRKRS